MPKLVIRFIGRRLQARILPSSGPRQRLGATRSDGLAPIHCSLNQVPTIVARAALSAYASMLFDCRKMSIALRRCSLIRDRRCPWRTASGWRLARRGRAHRIGSGDNRCCGEHRWQARDRRPAHRSVRSRDVLVRLSSVMLSAKCLATLWASTTAPIASPISALPCNGAWRRRTEAAMRATGARHSRWECPETGGQAAIANCGPGLGTGPKRWPSPDPSAPL
jgi:hypothetical protein